MTHGNGGGFILRRPDGTPMSRQEVIIQRRGCFKWLPVLCSNDLEHGSWWFAWGSVVTALSSAYPVIYTHVAGNEQEDDFLETSDYDITWSMFILMGVFFTIGSLAFVRAFGEPTKPPLLPDWKHFQTDELIGAWFFMFGMIPMVPYILVFFMIQPSFLFFCGLIMTIVGVIASYLFVLGAYPSEKKRVDYALPFLMKIIGPHMWAVKHLANDWLAGTWVFLIGNYILTFGAVVLFLYACGIGSGFHMIVYGSGVLCSLLFTVGSAYFVAGSYPHAFQFYYITDGGMKNADGIVEIEDDLERGEQFEGDDEGETGKKKKSHSLVLSKKFGTVPAPTQLPVEMMDYRHQIRNAIIAVAPIRAPASAVISPHPGNGLDTTSSVSTSDIIPFVNAPPVVSATTTSISIETAIKDTPVVDADNLNSFEESTNEPVDDSSPLMTSQEEVSQPSSSKKKNKKKRNQNKDEDATPLLEDDA